MNRRPLTPRQEFELAIGAGLALRDLSAPCVRGIRNHLPFDTPFNGDPSRYHVRELLASWLDHLAGVQANLPLTLTLDERAHLKLAARLLRGGISDGR